MRLANAVTSHPQLTILAALALSAGAAAAGAVVYRRRAHPDKLERLRRTRLALEGRLHDGIITDVQDHVLIYSYNVRGVRYHATQDVSAILDALPDVPARLIGPVMVRYTLRNPADSIVAAETWCGVKRPLPEFPSADLNPSFAEPQP